MMFVAASASVSFAQLGLVEYQAPMVTAPGVQLPPGTFPLGVTATNISATNPPGTELNGSQQDTILAEFSGGPVEFTSSRMNEGDFAINVGPNPGGSTNQPPSVFVNNFQEGNGQDPGSQVFPTTNAWRANHKMGIWLATVRQNGVGENNTVNGNSVELFGTAQFTNTFAQGFGYNMVTGEYANGDGGATDDNGAVDLNMGIAGFNTNAGSTEGVFDTAAAFFPYGQDEGTTSGWVGGYVEANAAGGQAQWVGGTYDSTDPFDPSSPDASKLPSYNVNFFGENGPPVEWISPGNAIARLESSQFNPEEGMLFLNPADGDNNNEFAVSNPDSTGWEIALYSNDNNNLADLNAREDSGNFSFLFVDWDSQRLTGALVDGATGDSIEERETGQTFDLTRLDVGTYQLAIDGVTPEDGALILSVAGGEPAFLSYEDDGSGNFIIESRFVDNGDLVGGNSSFPLVDSDFYFAYVDFTNPLAPPLASNGGGPGDRVIPEPSTVALLAGGFALTLVRRRRQAN